MNFFMNYLQLGYAKNNNRRFPAALFIGFAIFLGQASYAGDVKSKNPAAANDLVVSTINLKWYGLGGRLDGSPEKEKRDKDLNTFITGYLGDTDVFSFEEIVDVERLKTKVLKNTYNCVSYVKPDPKHQHVVLCYKKTFHFLRAADTQTYTWDDVGFGRLRPAVVGVLADSADRPKLLVVGVHLKAMPDSSSIRMEQAKLIATHIGSLKKSLPIVVLGDFNTFEDDDEEITQIFEDSGKPLTEINTPFKYTFRNGSTHGKFDRFWISNNLEVVGTPKVWVSCNAGLESEMGDSFFENDIVTGNANGPGTKGPTATKPANLKVFEDPKYYYDHISDHCPVSVTLRPKK